jgi:hypothetical protein
MAKQIEGRQWRFRPSLRPKLGLSLVGVWCRAEQVCHCRAHGEFRYFCRFSEEYEDAVRRKTPKTSIEIWVVHHENVSQHTSLAERWLLTTMNQI